MQKEKILNYLVLVNKCHRYREHDFEYRKLIETIDIEGNPLYLEKHTYEHFLRFKNRLDKEGIYVSLTSGYRSLEEQRKTIEELAQVYTDPDVLYQKVSPVGTSEHHTGLALDLTVSSKEEYQNRLSTYYTNDELDEREKKYQRIADISGEYGFILRYPKGKEKITGYAYEPWHFRYVGKKVASFIMKHRLTLEEYLALPKIS
ncbi:MAG: M15 family metallopeptidase [bacterium]|nr:M15 family metallopeptidase [bacterium]